MQTCPASMAYDNQIIRDLVDDAGMLLIKVRVRVRVIVRGEGEGEGDR